MSIREVDLIGVSKHEARKKDIKGIHSKKTKNEVRKISMQFANFVRDEFGVKKLFQMKEEHYKAFMASKSHLSLDYQRGIETHLRLLQEGLNKRAERFKKPKTYFCTEKRLIPPRSRLEGVSDRSIKNPDIIRQLKGKVSQNVSNAIDLMHKLGLRVSGATSVIVEDVKFDKGVVSIVEKGGRSREVPIPKGFEGALSKMVEGKEPHERLVPIKAGTVSDDIKQASKKLDIKSYTGTHAFRHTYARDRVEQLMTNDEKVLFKKCLSRYAAGKSFDYGVYDRELYDSMKNKMDQVHAELGHGKNRFDLAIRYMS